jgi:hypothetical protein
MPEIQILISVPPSVVGIDAVFLVWETFIVLDYPSTIIVRLVVLKELKGYCEYFSHLAVGLDQALPVI